MEKTKQPQIEALIEATKKCDRCELCKNVKNKVIGEGNWNAKIMFIGEAPGVAEDNIGTPFASKEKTLKSKCIECASFGDCFSNFINSSLQQQFCKYIEATEETYNKNISLVNKMIDNGGTILDRMLSLAEIPRESVFITNMVSCRPSKNGRNTKPTIDQMQTCNGRLMWTLDIVKPDILVFIGGVASNAIAKPNSTMRELVGKIMDITIEDEETAMNNKYKSTFIYHPAALLHNPNRYQDYMDASVGALKKVKKLEPEANVPSLFDNVG